MKSLLGLGALLVTSASLVGFRGLMPCGSESSDACAPCAAPAVAGPSCREAMYAAQAAEAAAACPEGETACCVAEGEAAAVACPGACDIDSAPEPAPIAVAAAGGACPDCDLCP